MRAFAVPGRSYEIAPAVTGIFKLAIKPGPHAGTQRRVRHTWLFVLNAMRRKCFGCVVLLGRESYEVRLRIEAFLVEEV